MTVGGLRAALAVRRRVRWRNWLNEALEDASDGVHSSLERRYVRDVERAHGLPASQHQARQQFGGKAHYRDNWYDPYRVVVEIDGPGYHQNEQVQQDKNRDNMNLALDDVKTHRFGPVAVTERRLRDRGPGGRHPPAQRLARFSAPVPSPRLRHSRAAPRHAEHSGSLATAECGQRSTVFGSAA